MAQELFIAVDVETTGFSPSRGDRVIEIGAVALQDRHIVGEFHSLINIGRRIPRSAARVHQEVLFRGDGSIFQKNQGAAI